MSFYVFLFKTHKKTQLLKIPMNKNDETTCKNVCSRGILKSCNVHSFMPISSIKQLIHYDFSKMNNGDTLYICTSAIPFFSTIINKIMNKHFILVSGDADEDCSVELFSMFGSKQNEMFNSFINNQFIIHWFSQNCRILNHPKISSMPIGLDYHTLSNNKNHQWGEMSCPLEQEQLLFQIKKNSLHFKDRLCLCYANFHFCLHTKYANDRICAMNEIAKNIVHYETSFVPRKKTWENQSKMAFVISPHGNGLDCHRTWEALALGCIPIVKTSPLNVLFEDLPVLIVENWSFVTKDLLNDTIIQFSNKTFNYEKLTLTHWTSQINNKKTNFHTTCNIII